jgi:DNA gyrase subunit A
MSVLSISEQGRATQGVKLIRVDDGDAIAAITQLDEKEEESDIEGEGENSEITAEGTSTEISSEPSTDNPESSDSSEENTTG